MHTAIWSYKNVSCRLSHLSLIQIGGAPVALALRNDIARSSQFRQQENTWANDSKTKEMCLEFQTECHKPFLGNRVMNRWWHMYIAPNTFCRKMLLLVEPYYRVCIHQTDHHPPYLYCCKPFSCYGQNYATLRNSILVPKQTTYRD